MRPIDAEALDCLAWKDGEHGTTFDEGALWVLSKIDEQPTIEPERKTEWIPVTERLPEEDLDILVTYVEKDEEKIVPVNYGRGTWFDCIFNMALNPVGVLAWMPLPEPYTGDKS